MAISSSQRSPTRKRGLDQSVGMFIRIRMKRKKKRTLMTVCSALVFFTTFIVIQLKFALLKEVDTVDFFLPRHLHPNETLLAIRHLSGHEKHKENAEDRDECLVKNQAEMRFSLQNILPLLVDQNFRYAFAWIRARIMRLWPGWVKAARNLVSKQNMTCRETLKILVHPGVLSARNSSLFLENQFRGGSLGELLQWSDLIAVLFILGHDVIVTSEYEDMIKLMPTKESSEKTIMLDSSPPFDIIYTDTQGIKQFKNYHSYRCKFRILDSFGTEPAYNHARYAREHALNKFYTSLNLNPRQFYTLFPHTADNSFAGFVVDNGLNHAIDMDLALPRQNMAMVYAKDATYLKNMKAYLDVIGEFLRVHATTQTEVKASRDTPPHVENHGILPGTSLHTILQQSKVFIGLGFPFENAAPLEAIADGAVFINPRFFPAVSSRNNDFYRSKPTSRQVTSQNPYAETMIGPPYVYTIDIHNFTEVRQTLRKILTRNKFPPFRPYELTEEGMLQRHNAYLQHQDFCSPQPQPWPPASQVTPILGQLGQSCVQACHDKSLLCEPSHFQTLNSISGLNEQGAQCPSYSNGADILHPSWDTGTPSCHTQADPLLFSCAGNRATSRRLCPCRTFTPGQIALCRGCS